MHTVTHTVGILTKKFNFVQLENYGKVPEVIFGNCS